MKRANNLYSRIYLWENLLYAFYKARKGKRKNLDVYSFERKLFENLCILQDDLIREDVCVGKFSSFIIHEPKRRVIYAAEFRERVLHHAVMNVCGPVFERFQTAASFACRSGKGTDKALLSAFHYTKHKPYFMKIDIARYFDSIDHGILTRLLERKIKDKKLLGLLSRIIDTYCTVPGKGVPIGNLTSQFFANYYLGFLDHYVKNILRPSGYIRYMDDILFFNDSKEKLTEWRERIHEFLEYELELTEKYAFIKATSSGVPFLKFLIKPEGIFLSKEKKKRFIQKTKHLAKTLDEGKITESVFGEKLLSMCAHASIARARKFRYTLFQGERLFRF